MGSDKTGTPAGPYKLYCDGSTVQNPGRGAYASLLIYPDGQRHVFVGSDDRTTNQRMELMAVLKPLQFLSFDRCSIIVYSDSRYVVDTLFEKGQEMRRLNGHKVKNWDLWDPLLYLAADRHELQMRWIRGHTGNPDHDVCDYLAKFVARNPGKEVPVPAGSLVSVSK